MLKILSQKYKVIDGYPYLELEIEGWGRAVLGVFGKRTLLKQGIVVLGDRFADKTSVTVEGIDLMGATNDPDIAKAYSVFIALADNTPEFVELIEKGEL